MHLQRCAWRSHATISDRAEQALPLIEVQFVIWLLPGEPVQVGQPSDELHFRRAEVCRRITKGLITIGVIPLPVPTRIAFKLWRLKLHTGGYSGYTGAALFL